MSSFGTSAIVRIITRRPTIPSLPNAGVSYRRCWERRSFWHAHAITSPLRYERRSLRQTSSPLAFVVRWKCHFPDNFTGRQILPPARHNPTPPTNSIVAAASTSTRISSTGLHRTSRFIAPLPHQRHLQLHRNRFIAALRKPLRVRALAHCPSTQLVCITPAVTIYCRSPTPASEPIYRRSTKEGLRRHRITPASSHINIAKIPTAAIALRYT